MATVLDAPPAMLNPASSSPVAASENSAASGNMKAEKLHGRAFYESLGSPKFVLAPMVDQSEFAWRMLTRSFMTAQSSADVLAYTPMLHARMFCEATKFRDSHFQPLRSGLAKQPDPAESPKKADIYLDGNPLIDRPLFAQFCANNPDELLEAAQFVAPFCDAVDLNLGCPQGIARKGNYGAFLQEDQDLIYRLINKLHTNLPVPVTAKMRVLESKEKTLAYAQKILSAGASILTVHGRHRDQKGHKTGLADWTIIRYLRENLPKDTVLFANGNILRRDDIDRCLEQTGADGVMSAEGNLHDPSIFATAPPVGEEGREYWRGRDGQGGYRMDAAFRRYMDILYKYVLESPAPIRIPLFLPCDPPAESDTSEESNDDEAGQPPKKRQKGEKKERETNPNLIAMQPHLFRMLRPLVSKHHNVRDALAKCRAGDIAAFENVLQLVEIAVRQGLIEYEATDGKSVEQDLQADPRAENGIPPDVTVQGNIDYESSVKTVRECKRPWWVCQPYVRPLPAEALQKGSLTLSKKELAELEKINGNKPTEANLPIETPFVEDLGDGKAGKINERSESIETLKAGVVCG